jgi:hypothetical protein
MSNSVDQLISNAQDYAQSLVDDASGAMADATTAVQAIGYDIPNYQPVTLPSAPPEAIDTTLPALTDVTLELPDAPANTLLFQDISPIEAGVAPVLTAKPPTITLPTVPAAMAAFTSAAPMINTNLTFPEPPSALMNPISDAPTLPSRVEPTKAQVTVPLFTALAPTDTSVAPTDYAEKFASAYQGAAPSTIAMVNGYVDAQLAKYNPQYATQMQAIETQLTKYLQGGTGLSKTVEDAIYARAQAKNDVEAKRVQDAALADTAARGFTLPTGILASAMNRARQDAANINAKAATDIAVAQAEMEQKNLQFAVTTSAGLRTTMLSATLSYMQNLVSINGQALDYAKAVLGAAIEVYNTAVKAFGVKLDAYRAEAAVYETRLKSAMAGIELYKAEVDALSALTNVDRAKVEVYRARIESLASLSNVYRAQIDAVQGKVGLEKLKLELFQSQVQAYGAQVQSKNAEWQGYSAAIEGQTASARIFSTQVEAFNAQITGYKATIDAKAEAIRATAATNQARATQYNAAVSGYSAIVQAKGEVARTKLETNRQVVLAFQAQVQAAVGNAQVASEYYKATSAIAINNADSNLKAQLGGIDSKRAYSASIAQLGTANANIYSMLASSAVAGMNTLASSSKNE